MNLTLNNHFIRLFIIVGAILLIPLVAMQFVGGAQWSLTDFMLVAVLLLGIGLVYELFIRKISTKRNRLFAVAGLAIVFGLIWIELAVGVFH